MHLTSMVKKKWTEKWKYSELAAFNCAVLCCRCGSNTLPSELQEG